MTKADHPYQDLHAQIFGHRRCKINTCEDIGSDAAMHILKIANQKKD